MYVYVRVCVWTYIQYTQPAILIFQKNYIQSYLTIPPSSSFENSPHAWWFYIVS